MFCIDSSELNCASCARNSPSACGCNGSWCCSCVTRRLRNALRPSGSGADCVLAGVSVAAADEVGSMVMVQSSRAGVRRDESNAGQLVDVARFLAPFVLLMPPALTIAHALEHEPFASRFAPRLLRRRDVLASHFQIAPKAIDRG